MVPSGFCLDLWSSIQYDDTETGNDVVKAAQKDEIDRRRWPKATTYTFACFDTVVQGWAKGEDRNWMFIDVGVT